MKNFKGKNNPNYIDGSSIVQHQCIDCSKKVSLTSYYGNCRCRSCARKEQYRLHPESHPMYKDGRTLKEYFCKSCGNKISINRTFCINCAFDFERNPNWKGGKSIEPYPIKFNITLKEIIRKRDDYTCQLCGEGGIYIHHIDYDKDNCKHDNLITLCHNCHSKTNGNRKYYMSIFNNQMENIHAVS